MRSAWRSLCREPRFVVVSVLILALGIGTTMAIAIVARATLFATLPYANADRLVVVSTQDTEGRITRRITGEDIETIRSEALGFETLAFYFGGRVGVQFSRDAEFAVTYWTAADLFQTIGAVPVAGRLFGLDEPPHVAVIRADLATRVFRDPSGAIGELVAVDGQPYTIVGVVETGAAFPVGADLWLSTGTVAAAPGRRYSVVGRLSPGVTVTQAESALRRHAHWRDRAEAPVPIVTALADDLVGPTRPTVVPLLGAVALVFLLAGANAAGLAMVRALNRSQELAIRVALGASRGTLARHFLAEGALVAVLAGAVAVVLGRIGARMFEALAPSGLIREGAVAVDGPALAVGAGCAVIAALILGLAPLAYVRVNGTRHTFAWPGATPRVQGASGLRMGLVVAQVALAFVLAAGTGLFVRSASAVRAVDVGYESEDRLVMYAHAPAATAAKYDAVVTLFDELRSTLGDLPMVRSVGAVVGLPRGLYRLNGWFAPGLTEPPALSDRSPVPITFVSPGYFDTLGIEISTGRDFASTDVNAAPRVAIVSEALVRSGPLDGTPLGARVTTSVAPGTATTVVGVVADVRLQSWVAAEPMIYLPLPQYPYFANEVQFVLWTTAPAGLVAPMVRDLVRQRDASVATAFTTMADLEREAVSAMHFRVELLALFGGVAVLLAGAGVYGTVTHAAASREREFGVRLALGAQPRHIASLVMRQSIGLALGGLAVGLAGAVVAGRLAAGLLFEIGPHDARALTASTVVLLSATLLAALLPARRACRVDAVLAIRAEREH